MSCTENFGIFLLSLLAFQLISTDTKPPEHSCFSLSSNRGQLYGQETSCFMIPISYTNASPFTISWNVSSSESTTALAFIQERSPQVKVMRTDQSLTACAQTSGLNTNQLPPWASSEDLQVISRGLLSHCFTKRFQERPGEGFYFDVLYKIGFGNGTGFYQVREVAYVLPNSEEYWIFQEESAIDRICTRCFGAGGLGQRGLVRATNLTELLQQLNCNHLLH